jgi:hypothetical protein
MNWKFVDRLYTLKMRADKVGGALGRRAEKLRLFPAVLVGVTAGAVIVLASQWFLRRLVHTNEAIQAAPIDITRVSLTIVTSFCASVRFDSANFTGLVSFAGTDFGTMHVSFRNPGLWGNPRPPRFDWGQDGAGKPENVEPQDWPPTTT